MPMDFDYSDRVKSLCAQLETFMTTQVIPLESEFDQHMSSTENPWRAPAFFDALKERARAEGLWNLFLSDPDHGAGLSNLEYAPLAEIMGGVWWAPEIFNCNAPDAGNIETLVAYADAAQQARWLTPMLNGEIRSGFAMTEPEVASSDATNIQCSIRRDGNDYIIDGRKWYTTGGMRENCELLIVMGKTAPDHADRHRQQSMILVPRDTPGVNVLRHLTTFGYNDAPWGEAEIEFDGVRVPAANLLLGEGRGFEIAQGRLGPGRIHHCMRLIGAAQRALELMLDRVERRSTFGRKLSEHQSVREDIAQSFCEIEQARLLTLKAAWKMDREGAKAARDLIAAIKVVAPRMAQTVIDRSIQIHGGAGLTQDLPLASLFNYARQIRLADGPDQVHMMALGRQLVREFHERQGTEQA